jgi:Replication Fork Protection Component Swi3
MHDVFPKARFRDCIGMTEKLGHQAQLRITRKQWIDESKPRQVVEEDLGDIEGLDVLEEIEMEQAGCINSDCADEQRRTEQEMRL